MVLVESLDCLHLQGRFETRSVEAELFWTERGECFRDMHGRDIPLILPPFPTVQLEVRGTFLHRFMPTEIPWLSLSLSLSLSLCSDRAAVQLLPRPHQPGHRDGDFFFGFRTVRGVDQAVRSAKTGR